MSTTQNATTCNCSKHAKCFHISTIVLLVATLGAALWAGCQVTKMETLKVGGKENFEKLQTIMKSTEYKEQYAQSLDLMLQQLNGTAEDDMFGGEEMIIDETASGTTVVDNSGAVVIPSNDEVAGEETISITDTNETLGD